MLLSLSALSLYRPRGNRPAVAISACLSGQPVRYDGTDKSLESTLDNLNKYLELIPICPEVGAGMTVPRAPVQLVAGDRDGTGVRVLGRDDPGLDVTTVLERFAHHSLAPLADTLCGYIVKSRSPSCGYRSTPVVNAAGDTLMLSSGIQVRYLLTHLPWVQIVDEVTLADPARREDFIARCLLLGNVRDHCDDLAGVHRHFAPLVGAMTAPHRQQLDDSRGDDRARDYLHAFGCGLNALVNRD